MDFLDTTNQPYSLYVRLVDTLGKLPTIEALSRNLIIGYWPPATLPCRLTYRTDAHQIMTDARTKGAGSETARQYIISFIAVLLSTAVALAAGEIVIRLKNSSMTNYDIEMWRYAKELKTPSPDPRLGHDHIKDASALLQSVVIRTNEWGLRGPPVAARDTVKRRILFLGSSITLGWGVAEDDTMTAILARRFEAAGKPTDVLNGGVGNYNAQRYVERFFTELKGLAPTDIVVHYFLRDAESLDAGGGNLLLRHSELAVTLWIAANRLLNRTGEQSLIDHYGNVYKPESPGYMAMQDSLRRLAAYAKANNIRLYLAMCPDVHNLKNYEFGFIHDRMRQFAGSEGYTFIDLLPAFGKLSPEAVWAMPGDPHPNALGHKLMADAIFPIVNSEP
jgi:lysophospholipase L1-like esterase